jgi:hypothetical protein
MVQLCTGRDHKKRKEQEMNKKIWCRDETGDISFSNVYNKMEIMP